MHRMLACLSVMLLGAGLAGAQAPQITALEHNVNGWVVRGTQVRFTLRGTAGGQAEVNLVGLPITIPLRERGRGTYDATWTPNEGVSAPRAPVMASLTVNGETVQTVSAKPLAIDTAPPVVQELSPADQATVQTARPEIGAMVDDQGGSGADPLSVKLYVDRDEFTAVTSLAGGRLLAMPPADLDRGRHTITLEVADQAGNQTEARWTITTAPMQAPAPVVRSDGEGWVARGETIRITANGPARARATFSLPGIQEDVPMREVRNGEYEGTWQAPAGAVITATNVPVLLRFRVGNQETAAQAPGTLSIDTEPPTVDGWHPSVGGQVNDPRPLFLANLSDGAGSGLDPATIVWLIDDRPLDADEVKLDGGRFNWRPKQPLRVGAHFARLQIKDMAGNQASQAWAFSVTNDGTPIRQVIHDARTLLQPGDPINIHVEASPGGRASVDIGGRVQLDLTEVQAGVYQGQHRLLADQRFAEAALTVTFVDAAGKQWRSAAQERISTAAKPNQAPPATPAALGAPVFTSPSENATVDSPLTITGRAAPGAEVRLKLDYSARVLILNVNGTLLEQIVKADDNGNWRLENIKLDGGVTGRGTQFMLTAWTVGDKDKLSDPATLRFRR